MQHIYADFLSHFKSGMMKANRYQVEFNLPRGISLASPSISISSVGANQVQMMGTQSALNSRGSINIKCHTATFPQRTLNTTELKQNTNPYRMPFSVIYDPVTFSFYADGKGDTRRYFDTWQNAVANINNHTMNFYDEFVSNVSMYSLNEAGQKTYGIRLYEAYPLSVGAMDVSYSQANNYQNVVCTLSYRYWKELRV